MRCIARRICQIEVRYVILSPSSSGAERMRTWLYLLRALFLFVAIGTPAHAQLGYDRRGPAYLTFNPRPADPAACATRCEHDNRCRAWSFSYPYTKADAATCALAREVPPRVEDDCCVSGVRGAGVIEPKRGALEYSIDRTGGDYRSFDVTTDATGAPCKTECEADKRCRAWTYVRPGYIDAQAYCHLKNRLTRPHHKPCCISGVVR
jgi:hypothetical protein